MKNFNNLCNQTIQSISTYSQLPIAQNIRHTILRNEEVLLQQKSILTKPQQLFKMVKPIILKLAQLNSNEPVKINIFKAINSDYCKQFEDDGLYTQLVSLFKDHQDSYFVVRIPEFQFDGQYGSFKVPQKFKNFNQQTFNYHNLPKIQVIPGIVSKKSQYAIKKYQEIRTRTINDLKKLQIALQIFKHEIFKSNDKNFGTIQISFHQITKNQNQIKPSLDEVISHELQHFLIFLLSIAKTSISFGTFFCNDLNHVNDYLMKPTEFFTLSRSYIKLLNKVFKKVKNKYSLQEFVEYFLQHCLFQKKINEDILKQLNNIKNFKIIKSFYNNMHKDQNFVIKTDKDFFNKETRKMEEMAATYPMKNKRFNTLLKWTVKILKQVNE